MRFTPDNFLYMIKQLITGSNRAPASGVAAAADGGIKVERMLPLQAITSTAVTDSTGGTASATLAAVTLNDTLTDSTGGTASTTFASITAGVTYTQADMTAVKNALASSAAENALIRTALSTLRNGQASLALAVNRSTGTTQSSKIPTFIVAAGTNASIGVVSFPIPRDYDEASDVLALKIFVSLASADAAITTTATPTKLTPSGTLTTSAATTGKLEFTPTAAALSTTQQEVIFSFSGLGLVRDGLLAATLALVGTTTGNTNIVGLEWIYESTIVSYHDTTNFAETGNPLR